jgi:hypothetical protein
MIGMRSRAHPISESEGATCPRCGRGGGVWEHAIPIGDAVAAIASDPDVLAAMDTGSCPCCGDPHEWKVVMVSGGHRGAGVDGASRRAALIVIKAQLALGRRPNAIASWVRSELGVVGILVEDCSQLGRALGVDWTMRRDGSAPRR